MTQRILHFLLRRCPADFRERCGDELVALHSWRAARRKGPLQRAALALREVSGLILVLLRLRAASLRRATKVRLPAAWALLRPDPARWGGPAVAGGAVMAFVGSGIANANGQAVGFTLVPVALLALAWGLASRARSAADLSRSTGSLAIASAAAAAAMAILLAVSVLVPQPLGGWVLLLGYPGFAAFEVCIIAMCVRGMLLHELPRIPAAAVTLGTLLIFTGLTPLDGVSIIGVWISIPGWVALARAPWGPSNEPSLEVVEA